MYLPRLRHLRPSSQHMICNVFKQRVISISLLQSESSEIDACLIFLQTQFRDTLKTGIMHCKALEP